MSETITLKEFAELSRRGFLRKSAAGAVAAGMLGLPGARAVLAQAKQGGELRVSTIANPSSLDPQTGRSGADHDQLFTLYDSLIEWEYETLLPKPGLAESWSNPDPKTLVLKLRQGVVFHDGTPFDAEAVKFNLERAKNHERSNVKIDVGSIDSIEVTGSHEVTLHLNKPDSALLLILSDRAGLMVSPKASQEAEDGTLDRAPVGTGAWRYVSWADNAELVVERNPDYWKEGHPLLDRIVFKIIPEINTGVRAVVAGENHFVYRVPTQQKAVVERSPSLKTVSSSHLWHQMMYLNAGRSGAKDQRLRQALFYAIDRDAFNKATAFGLGEVAYTFLPSAHWAFDPETKDTYAYNPDKARQLIDEAGLTGKAVIDVIGWPDQQSAQRQEVLIEMWRKAGIGVRLATASIPEATAKFFKDGAADVYVAAWTGRPDPWMTASSLYGVGSYYNADRETAHPEIEKALAAAQSEQTIEGRKAALARVQMLGLDLATVIYLVYEPNIVAFRDEVDGYRWNLLGKIKYEGMHLV